jgi:Cof subfamily protein (haloacid dehalogenase superfamily)
MKRDIALLIADVDGTLVDEHKVLTPRAIRAVQSLRAQGARFAVTSGRPPRGMAMLVEPLGLIDPIAGFNGGVFVKPDFSVIDTHRLDPAAAHEGLDLILKSGLDAWVYTDTEWLLRDPNGAHVAREAWTVKFDGRTVSEFTDEMLSKTVKLVGVGDDHARVADCEARAQQLLGGRASAARSQPYYLDITDHAANKGQVVIRMSEMLGIDKKRIATIGDSPNDVLMFKQGGFSIAMGQAEDSVKSQADAVTTGYNEDGFAHAIETFLLGDAS